jgi:hypothetical protein
MNNQELLKFEFLLTLENNIVCQRFFNVRDYNSQTRHSLDLYYVVKNISEEISEDLKIKTMDYLYDNMDFFYDSENSDTKLDGTDESFVLEIKLGDDVFIRNMFPANYYHPKVRYTVDIRPYLKRYLSELTNVLSSKDLETTYLNYEL